MNQGRDCENCRACFKTFDSDKPIECEWYRGNYELSARPDHIGVMFVRNVSGARGLHAYEIEKGAFERQNHLLNDISKKELIVLRTKSSTKYIGPESAVEYAKRMQGKVRRQ